jgi:hypothetical protein
MWCSIAPLRSSSSAQSYNQELSSPLQLAGRWFLRSGIQEPGGGVARYFRTDSNRNAPVSTEITGYAVSALAYLHAATGDEEFLGAAGGAAGYLTNDAWDSASHTFPFEPRSPHAYFFDLGIIVRGLMAAWRATGEESFRSRAKEAALSMAFDFMGDGVFHPVITLPEKQPVDHEPRWSRQPGCYQLKSALAWLDLGDDETQGGRLFDEMLAYSLATHEWFLADERDREKLMDRLHAYCYFLEALLFASEQDTAKQALHWGIDRVAELLREIAPEFERSDVCAQLLRVRLAAHHSGVVPLDESAAQEEADRAARYQALSIDPRLDGGYWFGRKRGEMLPYMNPVSTAFCMQALDMWEQHRAGTWRFKLHQLI